MPMLRLFFLALCLCLAPCTPRAEGLFNVGPAMPVKDGVLQIVPVTGDPLPPSHADTPDSLAYVWTVTHYPSNRAQEALAMRNQALDGDMDALFALIALSRLAEEEQRPSAFGAPSAFWEDWAVRMLGGKEAWFRIGAALYESSRAILDCNMGNEFRSQKTLMRLATDALHKAAELGHEEAMYALAFLYPHDPDKAFQMPAEPGFAIMPATNDVLGSDDPESRYWLSVAAAHGAARATYAFGLALADPESRGYDEQKSLEMLTQSMRLGFAGAAHFLGMVHDPYAERHFPKYAKCKSSLFYNIIKNKMYGEDALDRIETMADLMMEGNNEYFPEACLTRKEYKDATREAEQEFKRIKADMLVKKEAHDALYAKAQPMFAELRAAFAAQAKEKATPAEPFAPHAKDLFTRDDGKLRDGDITTLRIIPDQRDCPVYARAAALFQNNNAQGAATLREQALNGDMDALFALAALSRLAEAEKRPPLFGAPAAFWEDWAVRMLGGKEAWFRIGAALFECGKADALPTTTLQQMAADALRKAARLGHPEAMYALAYLSGPYPDKTFQMPKDPGFPIFPSPADGPEAQDEFRYWMSAAAFRGSARANYLSGSMYHAPDPKLRDEKKCFEMFSQSLRLGLVPAANMLHRACTPNEEGNLPHYADCKSSVYYGTILVEMADIPRDLVLYDDLVEGMLKGGHEYFPEACLTRKEYEDATREAEKEFERIKADMLAKKEKHDALYAKAQPMFAEMRAAFAAQAK